MVDAEVREKIRAAVIATGQGGEMGEIQRKAGEILKNEMDGKDGVVYAIDRDYLSLGMGYRVRPGSHKLT